MANNNKRYQSEWDRGDGSGFWAAVAVIVIMIAVAGYVFWPDDAGTPSSSTKAPGQSDASAPSPATEVEPETQGPKYPVTGPDRTGKTTQSPAPGTETEASGPAATATSDDASENAETASESVSPAAQLPSLENSDQPLREAVESESTVSPDRFAELFVPDSLIRHFVVTIDNMTRAKLPEKYDFTQPAPGSFQVKRITPEDSAEMPRYHIDPANFERYEGYLKFAEMFSLDRLVTIYQRYYPLFQSAYEELGYPGRYFNDRFVEVIDHLLATPEVERPVELIQPKVYYQFADQRLEDFSAGRKLMIRIGPDNAARIQDRLRDLRQRLTSLQGQL